MSLPAELRHVYLDGTAPEWRLVAMRRALAR